MLPSKKSAISHPLTLWLILIALPFALTGCSASFNSTMPPASVNGMTFNGAVHGGQQGIAGSHVYLLPQAPPATTPPHLPAEHRRHRSLHRHQRKRLRHHRRPTAAWTITGDYTCPSASSLVYLLALGGNPGLVAAPTTLHSPSWPPSARLLSLTSASFFIINEISTVASALRSHPSPALLHPGHRHQFHQYPWSHSCLRHRSQPGQLTTGLARTLTPSGGTRSPD